MAKSFPYLGLEVTVLSVSIAGCEEVSPLVAKEMRAVVIHDIGLDDILHDDHSNNDRRWTMTRSVALCNTD